MKKRRQKQRQIRLCVAIFMCRTKSTIRKENKNKTTAFTFHLMGDSPKRPIENRGRKRKETEASDSVPLSDVMKRNLFLDVDYDFNLSSRVCI